MEQDCEELTNQKSIEEGSLSVFGVKQINGLILY